MGPSNPYQSVGAPARGARFVGRRGQVQRVSATAESGRPSNMSIIGNHRTGKTSLVYRSLVDRPTGRDDLAVVVVNVGTLATVADVFRLISRETVSALEALPTRDIRELAKLSETIESEPTWYGLLTHFTALFSAIRDRGTFVLVVLDEFDRMKMEDVQPAHFQLLRDLCTAEWSSAGLITVSRQGVKSLEEDAVGGSSLDQVLGVRTYVGLFTAAERDELAGRAATVGIDMSSHLPAISARTGLHPYLLELLCYEVVQSAFLTGEVDLDEAYRNVQRQFVDFFARLLRIIDADMGGGGVDRLFQVIDGIGLNVSVNDALTLVQYGLVVESDDRTLRPFSDEFESYLRSVADGRDFRSVWIDCEVGLRRLIREVLRRTSTGGEPLSALPTAFDDRLLRARQRLARGSGRSEFILDELDYLYPSDLFEIIISMWNVFGPVVGGSKSTWHQRKDAVCGARNEVMHIRPIPGNKRLPAQVAASAIVEDLRRLGHL